MPVRRRLLVDAVKPGNVPAALGFDNATMYATRALGPLIGGVTYQAVGISGIYALIAMSYLVCLALATRVGVPSDAPSRGALSARGKLGFLLPPRELVLDRRFQIIMGVTLVYNLWCWPFTGMVPVIGQKDFALTPALVGALSACDGLGGTVGALAVGLLATPRTLFRFYFYGTLACLVLILGLALHLTVGAAVIILLVSGIAVRACLQHRSARDAWPRHGHALDLHRLLDARSLACRPAVPDAGFDRGDGSDGLRRLGRHVGARWLMVAHTHAPGGLNRPSAGVHFSVYTRRDPRPGA
jgi:hypothetical protein